MGEGAAFVGAAGGGEVVVEANRRVLLPERLSEERSSGTAFTNGR
jgi:hypothetical protein